jgi:DNA (cytosine-5)-methyltransferase 1
MNHGSLFSGIGGFDLAAEWCGWNNLFHCEWNPFGQKVLKHYWPEAESFNDITKTDFKKYANRIDILTGGFPCQPYSSAGKRKGKDDERHLWPEMLRAISEIRPRWVVGENVLGLVNWSGGLVFHEVQADLEAQGYEVQPFLLPAAAVNAPHRRDRIFFVAYSQDKKRWKERENNKWKISESISKGRKIRNNIRSISGLQIITNTNLHGFSEYREGPEIKHHGSGRNVLSNLNGNGSEGETTDTQGKRQKHEIQNGKLERKCRSGLSIKRDSWHAFPSESPICGGNDGLPTELDGITFSKWRNESIKGYGNAIVPQVVYQIFKSIQEYELQKM